MTTPQPNSTIHRFVQEFLDIIRFSSIFYNCNTNRPTVTDEIWTIKELAAYLKLNEKTAYALVAKGELPGFKVGGSWRFRRQDVEAWIEKSKNK
jgi:excisionase family DNA binding protein